MHDLVKIEGDDSLVRDMQSKAVLAISPDKMNDYYARKNIAQMKAMELTRQQEQIDELKADISQIKTMLEALLKR